MLISGGTQEAEAGWSLSSRPPESTEQILGHPGYTEKPCLQKQKHYININAQWQHESITLKSASIQR